MSCCKAGAFRPVVFAWKFHRELDRGLDEVIYKEWNGRGLSCRIRAIRAIRDGMSFVVGVMKHSGSTCRTGGNGATLGPVGIANQQVGFGRCSRIPLGVTLRFRE